MEGTGVGDRGGGLIGDSSCPGPPAHRAPAGLCHSRHLKGPGGTAPRTFLSHGVPLPPSVISWVWEGGEGGKGETAVREYIFKVGNRILPPLH